MNFYLDEYEESLEFPSLEAARGMGSTVKDVWLPLIRITQREQKKGSKGLLMFKKDTSPEENSQCRQEDITSSYQSQVPWFH